MLARIDLRQGAGRPTGRLPRARLDVSAAVAAVAPVCAAVRAGGAAAVREITARYDGVRLDRLAVPPEAVRAAAAAAAPALRDAFGELVDRVRRVHTAQLPPVRTVPVVPGGRVRLRWLPVRRAGVYVPGGRVAYPSSVAMNVVPAQVAGVESVAVSSPPRPEHGGLPHPAVLAACGLLGVTEVYAVGGAQAIAMLAYGAPGEVPPVDVVTGPGNVYVTAAKRLVRDAVSVDTEAGPTEVAVLADGTADPGYLAADLIAQAEHDPLAACLLVTPDEALVDEVDQRLAATAVGRDPDPLPALTGQSAAVIVRDLAHGLAVLAEWAPEHLELLVADAGRVAERVRNAGAVFVGPFTPVALGDYLAGSNHVLPTGGAARHCGGLTVFSFLRHQPVIEFDRRALAGAAGRLAELGHTEGLPGHVEAVQVRLR